MAKAQYTGQGLGLDEPGTTRKGTVDKNSGGLAIGKDADKWESSYKKSHDGESYAESLSAQVDAAKQKKKQEEQAKVDEAKNKASVGYKLTHNKVTEGVGNAGKGLVSGAVNTIKAPVNLIKTAVGEATGNQKAADNAAQATQDTYDQSIAKSVIAPFKTLGERAVGQVKQLGAPTRTERGLPGVSELQSKAAKNPEYLKATKDFKGDPGSDATLTAMDMAAKGKKAKEIRDYLDTATKAMDADKRKALGTGAAIVSTVVGGGSLRAASTAEAASKVATTAVAGGVGAEGSVLSENPNATPEELGAAGLQGAIAGGVLPVVAHAAGQVNPLVKPRNVAPEVAAVGNQVAERAAGRMRLGGRAVEGATTPEVTPIAVSGESKSVVGKARTIDEAAYTKETAKLSKAYDKEVEAIQGRPALMQRSLQESIDKKYADLQQQLDESAGKTQVSFEEKVKPLQDEKAKLQRLKVDHPGQPAIDETIGRVDKKIAEIQKVDEKAQKTSQSQPVESKPAPQALPKELQDLQSKLPAGHRVDQSGSVFDAKGKELTTGQIQELTQPKYLTDFEHASKAGDEATMKKIAAAHPDDKRVHIGVTEKKPAPQPFTTTMKTKDLASHEGAPDAARVAKHKADIEAGKQLDPIVVREEGKGKYGVEDGKHKLEAYRQAGIEDVPVRIQRTPEARPLKPIGEGDAKTSKLAASVQQKAVDKKLTDSLGDLPEYNQLDMKEQSKMAVDLLAKDEAKAIRIARGLEAPPADLLPESVFVAVENKALADGNVELMRQLAQSSRSGEATAMGQRIRALGERDPDSAVTQIRSIADARKKAIEARTKGTVAAAVAKTSREIKANVKTPTRMDWTNFVEGLKC
jgi:uncharacterized ParB-like nuclease family protein